MCRRIGVLLRTIPIVIIGLPPATGTHTRGPLGHVHRTTQSKRKVMALVGLFTRDLVGGSTT